MIPFVILAAVVVLPVAARLCRWLMRETVDDVSQSARILDLRERRNDYERQAEARELARIHRHPSAADRAFGDEW